MGSSTLERKHIAFFGVRNAGKSSLVNQLTGQELSVVSDVKGTTTDPVYKTMELLPAGPVMIIDTPGFDDAGPVGSLRAARARETLRRTDLAVLVVSADKGIQEADRDMISLFEEKKIPFLTVFNKADLLAGEHTEDGPRAEGLFVSALTGEGIRELKEKISVLLQRSGLAGRPNLLTEDLAGAGDLVVMVIPIDESAPKDRIILPQQLVLRRLLDTEAIPVVTKDTTYSQTLQSLSVTPRLVITDSQVFEKISRQTPADIPLTSFSILMARYKGILDDALTAVRRLDQIRDGDRILIAEGCTHHRQCNDIGTVKIPDIIRKLTGAEPVFSFSSGRSFPGDLRSFSLIIHCGGCMLNEKEMQSRAEEARAAGVPMINYGILFAKTGGILERSTEMLRISAD